MREDVQLTHTDHKQSIIKFPLSIIADDITDPLNVGSLFRLSDALGIKKLYLCGKTPGPPNPKINKTSRSTEKNVAYESHTNTEVLVTKLKASGCSIISLEITSSSVALNSAEFKNLLDDISKNNKPVCLILGSENHGVDQSLLALSDITTHIPMLGNNSSMNVVTAAGIACFEISRNL